MYEGRCGGVDKEKLWVLTSSKVKWMISIFGVNRFHVDYVFSSLGTLWYGKSTYGFQPNRDKGSWTDGCKKPRTSSNPTEIKAVELTDARRYVNMCKSVCFYIRLSHRILHRNSMGWCRLQEVSYKDTLLFVCLSYEYTCTLTRRDSSNINSGTQDP